MPDHDPYDAQHQTELEDLVRTYVEACPRTRIAFVGWLADHEDHCAALRVYDEARSQLEEAWAALQPVYRREEEP